MNKENIVFSDFFVYDETSPTCLRWKTDRHRRNFETKPFILAGQVAGTSSAWEYYNVHLWDKPYKTHRIILDILGVANYFDNHVVDHIDGNKANNKISNLRKVAWRDNCENRKMSINNVTGVTGVSWKMVDLVSGRTSTFAVASWKLADGRQRSKPFSVTKMGLLPAFKMVVEFRDKMISQRIEEGAAYTERHGK